jgi:hypothetical protein
MKNSDLIPNAASSGENATPLLIRWRGRQEGPYQPTIIHQKLAANEIGLLHEVWYNGKWVTLREYLAEQEAIRRAEVLAREEEERRAKDADEREAREREESQRAAALAQERRKNDLLERGVTGVARGEWELAQQSRRKDLLEQTIAGQSALGNRATPTLPHRGGMILTFALLGLLICFPFGIAAWAMGSADLAQMDARLMDASGRSMTYSGRNIGMLATILWTAAVLIYMFSGGIL